MAVTAGIVVVVVVVIVVGGRLKMKDTDSVHVDQQQHFAEELAEGVDLQRA